jgi:hypothetical protein
VAEKRTKVWIDNIQTRMTIRVIVYCLLCQVVISLIWQLIDTYRNTLSEFSGGGPPPLGFFALLTMIGFMSVLMYDAVRFMHRIVGPIYRFRKTVQAIADGDPVALVKLRKGDFLLEFRDDLNRMIEALEQKGAIVVQQAGKEAPREAAAR